MPVHIERQSGFSLIELMVVVAIIGILAAVAVPSYNDYIIRGKLADGISALSAYQNRVEQYYQDNRSYGAASSSCGVAGTSTPNFTITCDTTTGQDFIAKATSTALGFEFRVNEAGTKSTPTVPSGWTSSTTCWVRNKGGC